MRASSSTKIARRMLDEPTLTLVRVGDRVDHRDVAAGIHATLTERAPRSCWIHASDDLSTAFRFAVDQPDHPLLVTTATRDWSLFENDRAWSTRTAPAAFVVPSRALEHVPPQVMSLLGTPLLVRRNPVFELDDELRPLTLNAHDLMKDLLDDARTLEQLAFQVGIEWARIDASGATEAIALSVVKEARRCDLLDVLVERLHHRYQREDTRSLNDRVRRFYQRLEG